MATLTTNLFRGQGERRHRLTVVEGRWPEDIDGSVVVVGPDKRKPGGHWFAEHGLLEKIHLRPLPDGRILVDHRRVDTLINRIRRRLPFLFAKVAFMEVSPFGLTNFANTNVMTMDGRLFVGYDAGRPIEVDPETLDVLTPVGSNDEWLLGSPGILEPACAVAAHPAPDLDEGCLWFVNYEQVKLPGQPGVTSIARWDLDGPVRRWTVEGMSPYDSIHDIKATEHHLVFADLPFVFEPDTVRGKARTFRNQSHTNLWFVAKADLAATPAGGTVRAVEVQLPMPTGHLWVDRDEVDGLVRVVLQQISISDLMLTVGPDTHTHATGEALDPEYHGLITLAVQPSIVGRYLIDPTTGEVHDRELATDLERSWGGVLGTTDVSHPAARAHQGQLWYAGAGYDPDLVTDDWWDLYGAATDGLVDPNDLPAEPIAGSLSRIDLDSMKVAEVFSYADGAFPSPPTFVPRTNPSGPEDGYVLVVVHQDGPKELQLFDAQAIGDGPIARVTSPYFNPNLMLHSCWVPPGPAPRRPDYRISWRRDVVGALRGLPAVVKGMVRMGKGMKAAMAAAEQDPRKVR